MQMEFIKAAKNGDLLKIKELLLLDPDLVHYRDADQATALHYAAWKGYLEIAGVLLDGGADINAHNTVGHWGTTPLHAAAHGNQSKLAELLLQRGADINALDGNGKSPLDHTAMHNATAARKVLVKYGAVNAE